MIKQILIAILFVSSVASAADEDMFTRRNRDMSLGGTLAGAAVVSAVAAIEASPATARERAEQFSKKARDLSQPRPMIRPGTPVDQDTIEELAKFIKPSNTIKIVGVNYQSDVVHSPEQFLEAVKRYKSTSGNYEILNILRLDLPTKTRSEVNRLQASAQGYERWAGLKRARALTAGFGIVSAGFGAASVGAALGLHHKGPTSEALEVNEISH